ncbi:sodium:proton antiporter [Corallincola luteus]|uniref:Sodium:proton antiporter n=1 Tax=Corallincola luteus TaxID=1775177 RepID=A0ABY2AMB3_9GAMM|nr:cation:proton antiporter [Corallincola luteus]TCI04087.1 sodium:proton antiporter [Corallincola luteus]
MYVNLAILAAFIFVYSITCGGLSRTPINGAVVFSGFGLMVGPLGLGVLDISLDTELLRLLAELTLAMVLFTDASNANLAVLKRNLQLPQRLLLVGLPLTIILGVGVGWLLFDTLTLWELALLSVILAPTDAALGKAVVTVPSVPAPIREGLNVESGLNDGICVPILFVCLALATGNSADESSTMLALHLLLEEIGIGLIVAAAVTVCGCWLFKQCNERGWVTNTWMQLPVLTLAVSCFTVAQALGGSGFIAAFCGGLLFGWLIKSQQKHKLLLAAEGSGDTLALITWVVFGATVIAQSIPAFSWHILLYSVLSLTVIRMLPVFLVLSGLKMPAREKLFIGWFGPRGLASIVFAVIVLDTHLAGATTITMTVACTIILSVLGHGLSANPLIAALASRLKKS